jgi:hypothetical protein
MANCHEHHHHHHHHHHHRHRHHRHDRDQDHSTLIKTTSPSHRNHGLHAVIRVMCTNLRSLLVLEYPFGGERETLPSMHNQHHEDEHHHSDSSEKRVIIITTTTIIIIIIIIIITTTTPIIIIIITIIIIIIIITTHQSRMLLALHHMSRQIAGKAVVRLVRFTLRVLLGEGQQSRPNLGQVGQQLKDHILRGKRKQGDHILQ